MSQIERDALDNHLAEVLVLSDPARQYLMALWDVIQMIDDAHDGDTISQDELERALFGIFQTIPTNQFYLAHAHWLVPANVQMCMKWLASDAAERRGEADMRSYMWRAGFYDVVMLVAGIEHGHDSEIALMALRLYGETPEDYLEEFSNA